MAAPRAALFAVVLCSLFLSSLAQPSCSSTLTPTKSIQPVVASGYRVALVATDLSRPRSIHFDTEGNLLVVEAGTGSISALTFEDQGSTCLSVRSKATVLDNLELNHGIALSEDGNTLYASNTEAASSWEYNAPQRAATNNRTLINGMADGGHTTRTLLLSQRVPGMLLVSRGSNSNQDLAAADVASGHSQIRAFNLNNVTDVPYDYSTQGIRLGWGLRNSVGIAEHPDTGGIYSVENSVDEMTREKDDIHEDNPGEELNFHGYLNGTTSPAQGQNYGYPWCYAAWNVSDIPNNSNLTVGSQFAIDNVNGEGRNDSYCADQIPPRLTFRAHMAPLDMKFNNSGGDGWVSFHGSWDRSDPAGYKVSLIQFVNGEPSAPSDSLTAATDILYNADTSKCPDNCLRPVGLAFDQRGRLFVSSDSSGEIYVITRDSVSNGTSSTDGASSNTTSQGGSSSQNVGVHMVMSAGTILTSLSLFIVLIL